MGKNVLKVSVVIRCYNEEQHIGRLLSGVAQQSILPIEIVVVDSGSTDATLSIAAQYPVKIVSIRPEEFSFGRSLNFGCRAASGDFIVVASAHVYPLYRDWLEKLIVPFEDQNVAVTYGKQRGNGMTKYSEHQIFSTWFPDKPAAVEQGHPFCNNANAAIRRSVWEKYLYNEELTGLEDLDWAKRVIASGQRIVYVPEATVIHVHKEDWEGVRNRYRREAIALREIYPEEHFRFRDFLKLLTANIISDCWHAAHDRVLWASLHSIFLFRCMQFWGTYLGSGQKTAIGQQLKETFYYPRTLSHYKEHPKDNKQVIDYSQHEEKN